ncbi:MAG: glycosyltransferase, partial [Flavobacteriales bacterium]
MKVSIITITYNSAETLEDTIQSVLSQDYPNVEYIIVDGSSKDDTLAIVERYRKSIAVVLSEPDKGIYDAMNKGVRLATGDVIGILNSDDFYADSTVLTDVVANLS